MTSNEAPSRGDTTAVFERQVAGILSEILGVAPNTIPRQDSFLSYGCDSIVLAMLATRINEKFGVTLNLFQLFELSTIEALSEYLPECARASRPQKRLDGLQSTDQLEQNRPRVGAEAGLAAAMPTEEISKLAMGRHRTRAFISCGQKLFWRLAIRPELASYFNLRLSLMLRGPLDIPALQASLQELVNRHDALRVHFAAANPSDPENVELIVPAQSTPAFTLVEPERGAAHDPSATAQGLSQREIEEPFDLLGEPLVRFRLIRFGPTMHAFLVTMHHLITDAWSMNVFKRELCRLYSARSQGKAEELPALPVQYVDYAEWNHRLHQTEPYRAQLHYWDELFASLGQFDPDAYAPLRDRDSAEATSYADLSLAEQDMPRITARGARFATHAVTMYAAIGDSHLASLAFFPASSVVLVLSPVTERHRPELQHALGMYLTIVGVVSRISPGMTLREFVSHMKRSVQEALEAAEARQFATYDLSKRNANDFPLFVYNYFVLPNDCDWKLGGLEVEPLMPSDDTRRFITMLELYHARGPTGLWGALKYDTAQLNDDAIARFSSNYRRMLEAVLSGSDEVPVARLIAP